MTEIKKVERGTYGYYVVTRKGWGVFVDGRMIQQMDTKASAEEYVQRVLNREQKEFDTDAFERAWASVQR